MGLGMKVSTIAALTAGAGLVLAGCTTTAGNERARIVKAPSPCENVTVQIYFEPYSAEVTDEGRAVISQAATQAKVCKVDRVKVLGLADSAGAPADNMELSKQRVASVTKALVANGLPAGEFELAAVGQQGAVTQDGEARPLRRRADVTLELSAAHE
jgi:outer membrane protein OmpA-like peptidoglycan-associated protein